MLNTYKAIISPEFALLVFAGVLVVALIIANVCNPSTFDGTRTKVYCTVVSSFSLVITFLFYYALISLQRTQSRLDEIALTRQLHQNLYHVIDEINAASTMLPQFTLSLFPLKNQSCNQDPEDLDKSLLRSKLSYKIFALWQELLVALPFVEIEPLSFLTSFLQRASSPLLHSEWKILKCEFNQETQQFGDLLFCYACKIKKHTVNRYIAAAKLIMKDPIYKKIMTD